IPPGIFSMHGSDADLLDTGIASTFPPRLCNVNKGKYGHVLAVGGGEGMAGAIVLTAEAALRVGAGLVSVATHPANVVAINARRPELMVRGIEGPQALQAMIERASVVAIGPGLGQAAWGHALWDAAVRTDK